MNVKEAVQKAKQHLLELFNDEPITYVGLEEVEFDDEADEWIITISFARFWDSTPIPRAIGGQNRGDLNNKVFRIDDHDGRVKSIRDRLLISTE